MVAWIRLIPPGVRLSRAPRYDRFTRILPRFVYNAALLFIFYSRCGGRLLFFFVSSLRAQVRDPRCMPCLSCFCRHGELSSTLYADLVTSRTGARTPPALYLQVHRASRAQVEGWFTFTAADIPRSRRKKWPTLT